ncbi:MAG: helix-turn-helix domain-containing protein [Planctomycetia bacterium]|nr:helix-turn-helix domain-containing protein [Planctomycetia bacterium]
MKPDERPKSPGGMHRATKRLMDFAKNQYRFSPCERAVLVLLLAFANAFDIAWPSLRLMAAAMGHADTRRVKRTLKALRVKGVVEIAKRGGGRGHPTQWRIIMEKGATVTPVSRRQRGATVDQQKGATVGAQKGATVDHIERISMNIPPINSGAVGGGEGGGGAEKAADPLAVELRALGIRMSTDEVRRHFPDLCPIELRLAFIDAVKMGANSPAAVVASAIRNEHLERRKLITTEQAAKLANSNHVEQIAGRAVIDVLKWNGSGLFFPQGCTVRPNELTPDAFELSPELPKATPTTTGRAACA